MAQEITLKNYSAGEERFNWITHTVGAALSLAALVLGIVFGAFTGDVWKIVSVSVYGIMLVIMYTMSTLYHALPVCNAKKIFRIFDHCAIFLLIAGTYTPYTLVTLRQVTGWVGWLIFSIVWAAAVLGIVLNSLDLKKYSKFSMACYIIMGWCIVLSIGTLLKGLPTGGLILLLLGGFMYTIGAVVYAVGHKVKYMHSVWHIFVILASIFQFFSIFFYVI